MFSAQQVALGPDVTIGMSAYRNLKTTQEALGALFSSVAGGFQLILADDCSPDDTKSVFPGVKQQHPNTLVFGF